MKRIAAAAVAAVTVAALVLGVSTAMAAKPERVVEWSNGFPSGPHFNLNIHGKKAGFDCGSVEPGGGSLFVPEDGYAQIQYIMNKKSSLEQLYVHDRCAFGSPAKVQLPKGEYQVYARILGKPGRPNTGEERYVVIYPNLIDACNDSAEGVEGFGDFIDCSGDSLIGLGVVTWDGAFDLESETLSRVAPLKGKNKAKPMTDLFHWSGWVLDEMYDINGDGEITVADLELLPTPEVPIGGDLNNDLVIDEADVELYVQMFGVEFTNQWIFDIADLVVYGWDYENHGSKLVQVRFYPTDATEYIQ